MDKKVRIRDKHGGFKPQMAEAKWKYRKDLILFAFAIVMTATISVLCALIIVRPDVPLKIKLPAAGLLFFTARAFLRHLTDTAKL
ncbi:MAG TPA: hypothetical protein VM911_17975 [Pyrinomonadaceae bacterium]|jgi:hypothetical protein|nr:hypothetical protein [Pyrinomonadaceae bacterium]